MDKCNWIIVTNWNNSIKLFQLFAVFSVEVIAEGRTADVRELNQETHGAMTPTEVGVC